MNPRDSEKLERLIHETLRAQLDRRAPALLEARVLAEIARRSNRGALAPGVAASLRHRAGPWWKQSYPHWPVAARAGFAAVSALAVAVVVGGMIFLSRGATATQLSGSLQARFAGLVLARQIFATVTGKAAVLIQAIPPGWFYGVAGGIAACYAALLGLAAVAHRALSFARRVS